MGFLWLFYKFFKKVIEFNILFYVFMLFGFDEIIECNILKNKSDEIRNNEYFVFCV